MNKIELEKTSNELKGVAGTLLMMSEIPEGTYRWSEWVHYNLYRKLQECIERLDMLVDEEPDDMKST